MEKNNILDIEQESKFDAFVKADIAKRQYSTRFCLLTPSKWKENGITKLAFLPPERYECKILRGNLFLTAEYTTTNDVYSFIQLFAEFNTDDQQQILLKFDANKWPPSKDDVIERIIEKYILSNFPEKLHKDLDQLNFPFETLKNEACLANLEILHFHDQIDLFGSKHKTILDSISILIRVKIGEQLSDASIDSISAFYTLADQDVINKKYTLNDLALPTKSKILRDMISLVQARKLTASISELHVQSMQKRIT